MFRVFILMLFCSLLLGCQQQFIITEGQQIAENQSQREPDSDFLFGINGHAMHVNGRDYISQYNQFSLEEQIQLLKKLNLKIYRNDIHVDENGFWNGESPEKFEELLTILNDNEIQLLPMIFTNPWRTGEVKMGENWNYSRVKVEIENSKLEAYIKSLDMWKYYYERAFLTGKNFAGKYGNHITYYNIGNEIAYRILKYYPHPANPIQNPTPYESEEFFLKTFLGEDMEDFFTIEEHAKRTIASAAYVSGMIDGIKLVDKDAKCLVNDGKVSFGYYKFLEKMKVNYDIIGWNWYDGNFSLPNAKYNGVNAYYELNSLTNGKPIWITETNNFAGSLNFELGQTKYESENQQSETIKERLKVFYNLPNIEAVLIYELIDQEPKEETYWENYYGLISPPFPTKEYARPKPAFDIYRFTIEELQYGSEDLIYATLQDILKEEPTDQVVNKWNQHLRTEGSLEITLKEMIKEFDYGDDRPMDAKITKEISNKIIRDNFESFLNRKPHNWELRYWRRQLKRNPDFNQITLDILLSEEYWKNAVWEGYERRTGYERPD